MTLLTFIFSFSVFAFETNIGSNSQSSSQNQSLSSNAWEKIGQCRNSDDYKALQKQWADYHSKIVTRLKANVKTLNTNGRIEDTQFENGRTIPARPLRTITMLYRTENLIGLLNQLDTPEFFQNQLKQPGFQRLFGSEMFANDIMSGKFLNDLATSPDLQLRSFSNNQKFLNIISQIKTELSDSRIQEDIKFLVKDLKLNLLTSENRQSATALLNHFKSKGVTPQKLSQWINQPPLISEIPFPPKTIKGDFAISYRDSIGESVQNYLYFNGGTTIEPPTEEDAYIEHIASAYTAEDKAQVTVNGKVFTAGKKELEAIDGVARTIWGEALSCAQSGLPQFEVVAKNIADRSLAVCKVADQMANVESQKKEIDEYNSQRLVRWGLKPPQGFKNLPRVNRQAMSDFGRPDHPELHCAAQVISKPKQFSLWNSSITRESSITQLGGTVHPNIPNLEIDIKAQQTEGYDKALLRGLCPEPKNPNSEIGRSQKMQDLWDRAVKLASQVVLDPQYVSKNYEYVPKNESEVLFYTHRAPLPFAKELPGITAIKVPQENGQPPKIMSLRGGGPGDCNKLRLFQPKILGRYN